MTDKGQERHREAYISFTLSAQVVSLHLRCLCNVSVKRFFVRSKKVHPPAPSHCPCPAWPPRSSFNPRQEQQGWFQKEEERKKKARLNCHVAANTAFLIDLTFRGAFEFPTPLSLFHLALLRRHLLDCTSAGDLLHTYHLNLMYASTDVGFNRWARSRTAPSRPSATIHQTLR